MMILKLLDLRNFFADSAYKKYFSLKLTILDIKAIFISIEEITYFSLFYI